MTTCSEQLDLDAQAARLNEQSDLQAVLAAWHMATVRLQATHETLRGEVRRLTDELEAKNRELARKNRLADLGRMAAHIAHEVRNSLMPLSLYLSLLRRRVANDAGSVDVLDKIAGSVTNLEATVSDLLHFTAQREPRRQTVRAAGLIHDVLDSLAPQLAAQRIVPHVDAPGGLSLSADADMLRRALLNLLLNAIDAMPDGGDVWITAVDGPRGFEIEVADSGPGLSDEARQRLFEPFYTTKNTGTGLGLAIVQRIAEAHGGQVTACNCPEGGAAFTLRIAFPPQSQRQAA